MIIFRLQFYFLERKRSGYEMTLPSYSTIDTLLCENNHKLALKYGFMFQPTLSSICLFIHLFFCLTLCLITITLICL